MHCPCCSRNRPNTSFACHRCITANLRTFRRKIANAQSRTTDTALQVERKLLARPEHAAERAGRVENIRRETVYVRRLVDADQTKLDELQNRVARRREALDRARKSLDSCDKVIHGIKAQARAKRKEWRSLHDEVVACRQARVRECLDLYLVRRISDDIYEIGGRRMPHLLRLHDCPANDTLYGLDRIIALIKQLSIYLGMALPFPISLAGPDTVSPRISLQAGEEQISLSSQMDALTRTISVDQSEFLAALMINLRMLIHASTLAAEDLERSPGYWLCALLSDPQLGTHSDGSALNYIRAKQAFEPLLAIWAKRIVEEHLALDANAWEQVELADGRES